VAKRKVGVEVSAVKREEGRGERCQRELDAEVLAMATVKVRGERGWTPARGIGLLGVRRKKG
jgi:hypothetical protein